MGGRSVTRRDWGRLLSIVVVFGFFFWVVAQDLSRGEFDAFEVFGAHLGGADDY